MRSSFSIIAAVWMFVVHAPERPQARQAQSIAVFSMHDLGLKATGKYTNPYAEVTADASLTGPDGRTATVPLFWDGASTWKSRVAPDRPGQWRWLVKSATLA